MVFVLKKKKKKRREKEGEGFDGQQVPAFASRVIAVCRCARERDKGEGSELSADWKQD